MRADAHLYTLDAIARLTNPDKVTNEKGPGTLHVRLEIQAARQACAKAGTPLTTHQLLIESLSASTQRAGDGLSEAGQTRILTEMRDEPLAVQRGQLAALLLLRRSELMQAPPEAAADALLCLLVPGTIPRSRQAETLHRELKRRMEKREKACKNELKKLGRRKSATPEEKASLKQQILRCKSDMKQEKRALKEMLARRLEARLPAGMRESLTAIKPCGTSREERAQAFKDILRKPLTSSSDLVALLESDSQLFDALRVVWGARPLSCMRFARVLSELLKLSDDPDSLLLQVEARLVARLGEGKLQDYSLKSYMVRSDAAKISRGSESISFRVQWVMRTVDEVLTPPKPEAQKKGKDLDKPKTKKELLKGAYATAPENRPWQAMLDWLQSRQIQASVQAAPSS
jgi:hypothetical protein